MDVLFPIVTTKCFEFSPLKFASVTSVLSLAKEIVFQAICQAKLMVWKQKSYWFYHVFTLVLLDTVPTVLQRPDVILRGAHPVLMTKWVNGLSMEYAKNVHIIQMTCMCVQPEFNVWTLDDVFDFVLCLKKHYKKVTVRLFYETLLFYFVW